MKFITILMLLAAAVSAVPTDPTVLDDTLLDANTTNTLVKRDTEIVYLANCVHSVSCCDPPQKYSQVVVSPCLRHPQPVAIHLIERRRNL